MTNIIKKGPDVLKRIEMETANDCDPAAVQSDGLVFWGLRKIGRELPDNLENVIRFKGTAEELLRPGYEIVKITILPASNS